MRTHKSEDKKNQEDKENKGYDPDLDVMLEDLGDVPGTKLKAAVMCYNGGEAKLSIFQMVGKKTVRKVQLFRLPLSEAQALGQFLSAL